MFYGYAIIEKETNRCCQIIKSPVGSWSVNNPVLSSMMVDVGSVEQYLDKYFYDNTWWKREWVYEEAVDEEGNSYQKQTEEYVDYPWSPLEG